MLRCLRCKIATVQRLNVLLCFIPQKDSEAPSSSKGDPAPNGDVTVAMPPPVMTSTPRAKPASAEGAIIDAKKAAADILAIGGFESNEASLVRKCMLH
ncbi:hypothetical protein DPMN_122516 [Dreissena polymorpha]|uniref:Uncharacterized protein n=1 Tax=Dreissena polymorpha TaxID=45954 RepID=A0A9D4GPV8_DREPO|nr:hypothetical protein DPMN_122516 [Dreissena polymorpha]